MKPSPQCGQKHVHHLLRFSLTPFIYFSNFCDNTFTFTLFSYFLRSHLFLHCLPLSKQNLRVHQNTYSTFNIFSIIKCLNSFTEISSRTEEYNHAQAFDIDKFPKGLIQRHCVKMFSQNLLPNWAFFLK